MEPKLEKKAVKVPPLEEKVVPENEVVLKDLEKPVAMNYAQAKPIIIGVYVLLVILGIGTGYLLSRKAGGQMFLGGKPTIIKTDKVAGSTDTKTFKDSAVGVIEKGGVDGEGTHKLIREGGPSQTAFLMSSVVDLDEYVGKKVKVWGETFAAKKAAWLMDVGKIEIQQ